LAKKKFRVTIDDEILEVEVEVEEPKSIINRIKRILYSAKEKVSPISSPPLKVSTSKNEVRAPLPGRVISIDKKIGDQIKQGDVILTLESMKTRVEIRSPISGILRRILVKEGQVVKQGDLLAIVK